MTPPPFDVLPDEWKQSVLAGNSIACRRVFENGKIIIENKSSAVARLTVMWLTDIENYHGEKQIPFQLVPGGILEFSAEYQHDGFLDWLVVDHVEGGNVTVSQVAPPELLN